MPPTERYSIGPKPSASAVVSSPMPIAITAAWVISEAASSIRPAPIDRARAEATPPPIAPPEVMFISISSGSTSA